MEQTFNDRGKMKKYTLNDMIETIDDYYDCSGIPLEDAYWEFTYHIDYMVDTLSTICSKPKTKKFEKYVADVVRPEWIKHHQNIVIKYKQNVIKNKLKSINNDF